MACARELALSALAAAVEQDREFGEQGGSTFRWQRRRRVELAADVLAEPDRAHVQHVRLVRQLAPPSILGRHIDLDRVVRGSYFQ